MLTRKGKKLSTISRFYHVQVPGPKNKSSLTGELKHRHKRKGQGVAFNICSIRQNLTYHLSINILWVGWMESAEAKAEQMALR